jgi:hypothetical protein
MRGLVVFVALASTLAVVGCRTTEIYDVPSRRLPAEPGRSVEDVGRRIEAAVVARGWKPQPVRPGEMIATLDVRKHEAVVTIDYDESHFSIRYRDSKVLKYDGKKIHRNYNRWVHNLERRILQEFGVAQESALEVPPSAA